MTIIKQKTGNFEYKIVFTNPDDSTSKDTVSNDIKLSGGLVSYFENGAPDSASVILDNTSDALWIDELFLVDIYTKGTAEGTWLSRFTGTVRNIATTPGTVTLKCNGLLNEFDRRLAVNKVFFDVLTDKQCVGIEHWSDVGWPSYVPLDNQETGKRSIRPLVEVIHCTPNKQLNWSGTPGVDRFLLDWDTLRSTYQLVRPDAFLNAKYLGFKTYLYRAGAPATNFIGWKFEYMVCADVFNETTGEHEPDPTNILMSDIITIEAGWIPINTRQSLMLTGFITTLFEILSPSQWYWIGIRIYEEPPNHGSGEGFEVHYADPGPYEKGHCCKGTIADAFTQHKDRDLHFYWRYGELYPKKENIDFTVDYDWDDPGSDGVGRITLTEQRWDPPLNDYCMVTNFKGYPTITQIITALHDDYLSDITDSSTITPTSNVNIRPLWIRESTVLNLLLDLIKLGNWTTRLYKDNSGNKVFEFVDAYEPSDWGGAPFTGAYANLRKCYYGGDAAGGEEDYIRIVSDHRRIVAGNKINALAVYNPEADILLGARIPSSIVDFGILSIPALHTRVADTIDELVTVLEQILQGYGQSKVDGRCGLDKVSMLTADDMLRNCNDLLYIKDTRIDFDGAHKVTQIDLDLKRWDFSVGVTNIRPPMSFDKLLKEPSWFHPSSDEFVDQGTFRPVQGDIPFRGEYNQATSLILVESTSVTYNPAAKPDKIECYDDAQVLMTGTVIYHEVSGGCHPLDVTGNGSPDYYLVIAKIDNWDGADGTAAYPVTINKVILKDGAAVLKTLEFKTPWPGSPGANDFFHPDVLMHRWAALYVCWVIAAP